MFEVSGALTHDSRHSLESFVSFSGVFTHVSQKTLSHPKKAKESTCIFPASTHSFSILVSPCFHPAEGSKKQKSENLEKKAGSLSTKVELKL